MASARPGAKLIGIHGIKKSGKDTVADYIQQIASERHESYGKDWFARRMKESIAALFDIPLEAVDLFKLDGQIVIQWTNLNGDTNRVSLDGREFLQRYGTESHRGVFGWDFWIDQLLPLPPETYEGIKEPWRRDNFESKDVNAIADVRFENEIQRIHDLGGLVIYLDKPQPAGAAVDTHVSERMFPDFCDAVIVNNGTLEDLEAKVRNAITGLYG